ncbi:MAG: endonuclease III [Duodenibacillus sp.]|nr:endonuclease III [Duodenibacillus sp.]
MTPEQRKALFKILAEARPDPKSELEYSTPFELLVAVMLSAQATDKSVNLATRKLFARAATPEAVAALKPEGLEPYIRTIGLFRAKAKNICAACELLIARHGGEVPGDFDALVALPGVGAKTADVVLNVAFGRPTIAVDTHIFRVANRTGLAPAATPEAVSAALLRVTPPEYLRNAHHWLLLHGRYCCKARKPDCPACPVRHLCEFEGKAA